MWTLLCSTASLHAEDSLTKARIDMLNRKLDTLAAQHKALGRQLSSKDSAATAAAIDSSFSRALAEARLHPEKLYNQEKSKLVSIISYLFLVLFLFCAFYYLATSALCRDDSYGSDCKLKEVKKRSFSYGRVQLFWWTVIILSCYIWFFARYNILLPLNPTVVLLLGSGLAVFIFGKTIDNSQIEQNNVHQPTRHQDIYDSAGFLSDILSDDNGISIHRLQAVAFNIIFGIGFLSAFFMLASKHAYPFTDFEPWQFSLLGISAIGYLGLKTSENPKATLGDRKAMKADNEPSPENTGTATATQETPAGRRINVD